MTEFIVHWNVAHCHNMEMNAIIMKYYYFNSRLENVFLLINPKINTKSCNKEKGVISTHR
jgi:hypothetical protein